MPKIINKRKSRFVIMSRELMADTRLKSNHKILYAVLCSLAESCDEVFPSYTWLAEQIGYETEGKTEAALKMFMKRNMEPLIVLGLIKIIPNVGDTNDYEVYDYEDLKPNPEQKCYGGGNKNVTGTGNKNVTTPIYGERRIEKEDIRESEPEILEEGKTEKNSDLQSYFDHPLFGQSKSMKFQNLTQDEIELCIRLAVDSEKSKGRGHVSFQTIVNYLSNESIQKNRKKPTNGYKFDQPNEQARPRLTIDMSQWPDEDIQDFESRCQYRANQGDTVQARYRNQDIKLFSSYDSG